VRYQKTLDSILARKLSRAELVRLRINAMRKLDDGDREVKQIIDAIDQAVPSDEYVVFMGFCPGADFENRLDIKWKKDGTCTFIFHESPSQVERFASIYVGDLLVLKKRQKFGETMWLYGHGRVNGIRYDSENHRYLTVGWSKQEAVIEVPLMGCNSTVDIRSSEAVAAEMPEMFYRWLADRGPTDR
jgi:hypothetical protein